MSGVVVVDDQAVDTASNQRIIEYFPPIPEGWLNNGMCVGCNITHSAAQELLYRTVTGGTWTNAWWRTAQTRVTASLDFEGTRVAAYFVFFWRSQDPNSVGKGSLQFIIDNELKLIKNIDASELAFQYDISPRTLAFQQDGLDPNKRHRLTIAWVNDGPRPRVAVALDAIEYTPSSVNAPAAPTPTHSNTTSLAPSDVTKIVAPVVSIVVLALVGLGIFLWYRRRRLEDRALFPPGSPEFDPFVETSEGRRYYNVSGVYTQGVAAQPRVQQYPQYNGSLESYSVGDHTQRSTSTAAAPNPPPYSEESTSRPSIPSQEGVPVALPHPQSRTKSQLPQSMTRT